MRFEIVVSHSAGVLGLTTKSMSFGQSESLRLAGDLDYEF